MNISEVSFVIPLWTCLKIDYINNVCMQLISDPVSFLEKYIFRSKTHITLGETKVFVDWQHSNIYNNVNSPKSLQARSLCISNFNTLHSQVENGRPLALAGFRAVHFNSKSFEYWSPKPTKQAEKNIS